ncbi:MAG: DNA alkylation repair protein [Nanoarchaeota archaeon]
MNLKKALRANANPARAAVSQRFFKTGKGQYGEGDVFIGLTVPDCRLIAKKFAHIELKEVEKHLQSKLHEERLVALLILVEKYQKNIANRKSIFDFYLANLKYVNNWDLVDLTAHNILGDYLLDKDKDILCGLAKSNNLWERRISIVSTFGFIKNNRFEDTLKIVKMLLADKHDLIHKACGWMLREVGKRDEMVLKGFLKQHYKKMPRTMLRYAIERFPEKERKAHLAGAV